MPFTLSHVAAVLPLLRGRKSRWSATGLIAGSIAPDFEKFLRLGLHNRHSHTWGSLLYFSCPVALGLAALFHLLVRDPLIEHLPRPLYQRLARFQQFDWLRHFRQHYTVVVLSVLVGGVLHLLWDSFTHRYGLVVRYYPWLLTRVPVGKYSPAVFTILNLLSSAVGLGLVVAALRQLPPTAAPPAPAGARAGYWGLAGLVALAVLGGRALLMLPALNTLTLIISTLSAAMLGVVAASGYFLHRTARSGRFI